MPQSLGRERRQTQLPRGSGLLTGLDPPSVRWISSSWTLVTLGPDICWLLCLTLEGAGLARCRILGGKAFSHKTWMLLFHCLLAATTADEKLTASLPSLPKSSGFCLRWSVYTAAKFHSDKSACSLILYFLARDFELESPLLFQLWKIISHLFFKHCLFPNLGPLPAGLGLLSALQ